jgi:hypothetical protein
MEPQDVTIGNQRQINVTLRDSAIGLDEVVVTALGIRREARTLGYATANYLVCYFKYVLTETVR